MTWLSGQAAGACAHGVWRAWSVVRMEHGTHGPCDTAEAYSLRKLQAHAPTVVVGCKPVPCHMVGGDHAPCAPRSMRFAVSHDPCAPWSLPAWAPHARVPSIQSAVNVDTCSITHARLPAMPPCTGKLLEATPLSHRY